MIWVEICNQSMFGHRPQHISRAPVSKVKSNDPVNREKYIEDVLLRFESEDIMLSFATLQQFCESQRQGVDVQQEIEYLHEELSTKMHKIRSDVDSNLSKFYNGSTPWSPQIQTHRDRIDYWHSILRTKTGVLTSKNKIKKLSIKLGEYSGHYLNAAEALTKLKCAWKEYRAAKKNAYALRVTFQEEIIAKKAIDRKVTPEQMTKMMIREERARQEGRDSKQIRGETTRLRS